MIHKELIPLLYIKDKSKFQMDHGFMLKKERLSKKPIGSSNYIISIYFVGEKIGEYNIKTEESNLLMSEEEFVLISSYFQEGIKNLYNNLLTKLNQIKQP